MNVTLLNTINLDDGTFIKKGGVKLNNQEKTVDIRENGTITVVPDKDFTGLNKVSVNVNVVEEIEGEIIPDAIRFIDYDGTILYTYSPQQIEEMTELPPLPSHKGLICEGWNYTLDDIKNQYLFCEVGAVYTTDNGATKLCIDIVEQINNKIVTLYIETTKSNNVMIDWGDGQSEIVESSGGNSPTHKYSIGTYIIQIYSIDNSLYKLGLMRSPESINVDTRLKELYLGNNVEVTAGGLGNNYNLEILTISSNILSFPRIEHGRLKCLIFPKGTKKINGYKPMIGSYCNYSGASNFRVSIPNTVTEVWYGISPEFGADRIIYPSSVTTYTNFHNGGCSSAFEVLYDSEVSTGVYPKYVFPPKGMYVPYTPIKSNAKIDCLILNSPIVGSQYYQFTQNCNKVLLVSNKKLYPITDVELEEAPLRICSGLKDLKTVTIHDTASLIGRESFYGCTNLKSVIIPDSVTSIEDGAFKNCFSLTSVRIPDSVTSIGASAFFECRSLTSITIPNSVTSIGSMAFQGCSSFTSVTIPDSITEIANSSFYNCNNLSTVILPNGITSIGASAFLKCHSLKNIVIPDSVVSYSSSTFQFCNRLEQVSLSNNASVIPEYMFANCHNLSSIDIPGNVTTINQYAFQYCYGLRNVILSNGVTEIGKGAFGYTGLHYLQVPSSVNSIKEAAFGSSSLRIIDFSLHTTIPSVGSNTFYNNGNSLKIIVPDSLYDEWIVATNWSSYASYIIKKSDWDAQNA